MDNKKKCPVCGYYTLPARSIFEDCPVCGWEDDPLQSKQPDYEGGANEMSLNQYKAWWQKEHHREGLAAGDGCEWGAK
jgi:hypothetical protein